MVHEHPAMTVTSEIFLCGLVAPGAAPRRDPASRRDLGSAADITRRNHAVFSGLVLNLLRRSDRDMVGKRRLPSAIEQGNDMSLSGIFARIVALIGAAAVLWRRLQGVPHEPAWGSAPVVPAAKPQGSIPTLKMPTAQGWSDGQKPVAAPGSRSMPLPPAWTIRAGSRCCPTATCSLQKPRSSPNRQDVFGYAMQATCGARGARRQRQPHHAAARRRWRRRRRNAQDFPGGLNQPFGMALLGDTFYVGNTDGVVAFPYIADADHPAPGRKLVDFKPGGHWTRNLLSSPDGQKLYAGVGSLSNVAENGMEGRKAAPRSTRSTRGGASRIFAGGLRNPVGLAWEPETGVLWTVVNERDGLGDERRPTI